MQTLTAAINSRAKLPANLAAFCKKHNLNHRTLLSINPKTEKSKEETRILHFAPSIISGKQVCPNAGNCALTFFHSFSTVFPQISNPDRSAILISRKT
jgi:hypothetical protein